MQVFQDVRVGLDVPCRTFHGDSVTHARGDYFTIGRVGRRWSRGITPREPGPRVTRHGFSAFVVMQRLSG